MRIRTLLREDVAGGKRSRSATQDEEEPPRGRTRTLPPISLEERARAQGEKRKRAVGLSHPLPTAAVLRPVLSDRQQSTVGVVGAPGFEPPPHLIRLALLRT